MQELELNDEDSCSHRRPLESHAGDIVCSVSMETGNALGQLCLEGFELG